MHGSVVQWLGSIAAGLAVTAILHMWRRGATTLKNINRVVRRFDAAGRTIEKFGRQWEAAVRLDEEIRADRADMEALIIQLGTAGRDPAWASIEAYLHEWRHEQNNDRTVLKLLVGVLEKIAVDLRAIAGDLRGLVNR